MLAHSLMIESKHRRFTPFIASLEDFSYTRGDAVGAEIVRTSPDISLYCLDDEEHSAIFVELPPHVDLARAPFVYQAQYDQALRLIAVPYATFRQLAHELPAIDRLIIVYSSGRSGSTLVSHLLNAVDGVVSLSEPDAASQFAELRHAYEPADAALRDLLDCTVRFLFKPSACGERSTHALKHRSWAVQTMDLFQATFPHAKNLYLYRDAVGFVASFYRIVSRADTPWSLPVGEGMELFSQNAGRDMSYLMAYLDEGTTELSIPQYFTLVWLTGIEEYLAQYARGIPVLAVRYDDLTAHREQVARAILTYCGLPALQGAALRDVFSRDAQAGTSLARDKPDEGNQLRLSDQHLQEITSILQRHPVVKTADFVVPGTLSV